MTVAIGILSGKGGVGKTTIALNLGMAFRKFDESVYIIDGDIKNPNLGLYLGIYQCENTLNDFLKKSINFESVQQDYEGMKLLPASLSLSDADINLGKLKESINSLDGHVFIDFPPGLTRETMSLLDICDKAIIITNPTIPSLASTMRFINILKNMNKNILGIIINKAGKKYEITIQEIEAVISECILTHIRDDENIRKSAMAKKTILEYKPYSETSIQFMRLAARMLSKEYQKPQFARIKHMMRYA